MKKLFLLILILLNNCFLCYGAELSATVCPSGCDYTSLGAAVVGEAQDLTDNGGDTFVIEISGSWSSTDTSRSLDWSGWTLSSDNYLKITATGDARTNGVYDSTNWVSFGSSLYAHMNTTSYVRWDGLTFRTGRDGQTMLSLSGATDNHITGCLFMNLQASSQSVAVYCTDTSGGLIANNVFNFMNRGISTNQYVGCNNTVVANNTLIDMGGHGFYSGSGTIYKNNIVQGSGTQDYYCWNCTFSSSTNESNISSDTSSPNSAYRSISLTFHDSANKNFRLASTDTDAIDNGVSVSSLFTTDMDGNARSGTWDIGAYEYISSTPATRNRLMIIR